MCVFGAGEGGGEGNQCKIHFIGERTCGHFGFYNSGQKLEIESSRAGRGVGTDFLQELSSSIGSVMTDLSHLQAFPSEFYWGFTKGCLFKNRKKH
jgi:Fe-S-cluster containining protein